MKKILWALILLVAIQFALIGCMGKVVDMTVVIKNATEYELRWVVFNMPQKSGTYSPMKHVITGEDEPLKPDEEREVVIGFVESDFGYDGFALIGLLDDGSSDSLETAKGAVVLERGTNRFVITHDGENFVITNTDAADISKTPVSANAEPGASSTQKDEFYLTLFADFPGETLEKGADPLPVENEPASPSLIAFYLADELSAWTGLDFTLNDVSFGEDSITVDWSKGSTLIAGYDGREWKEDFRFFDGVSLNWFMMDSLAMTLKNNLDVTTVYYCSDGGSVTFPNPEDMAAQGLPELPVDQSYEGSTFFISHAGGRGDDDLPIWNGYDFGPNLEYSEEYTPEGDPGEYLSTYEAAKLVFTTVKEKGNIPEETGNTEYMIVLTGIETIGESNEECYVYRLEITEPDGVVGAPSYAYAYQSGNLYMQDDESQWVLVYPGIGGLFGADK